MKKIISILLSLLIITTGVSSLAFASETGLISSYNPSPSWFANTYAALGTSGEGSETVYTVTRSSKAGTATLFNAGPVFDITTTYPQGTKFIKLTATFTPKLDITYLRAFKNASGTTANADKINIYPSTDFASAAGNTNASYNNFKADTSYELTYLLDIEGNYLCVFCDDMLVCALFNLSGLNTMEKFYATPYISTNELVEGDIIATITNVEQKAYDSTATFKTLGLYTYKAEYADGQYIFYPYCTSAIYDVGGNLTGTANIKSYVAGYGEGGKLLFAKDMTWSSRKWNHFRQTSDVEVDELKVFYWNAETLKPYMPVSPVKTNSN